MTDLVASAREPGNPLAGTCAFTAGLNAYCAGDDTGDSPFDLENEMELHERWVEGWTVARRKSRGTRPAGTTSAAIIHDKLEETG